MEQEHHHTKATKKEEMLSTSGAIIIAALIIGFALFFGLRSVQLNKNAATDQKDTTTTPAKKVTLSPITENDHIRGDVKAPIAIIEFADLQCVYCKAFHPVMQKLMETYGDKIVWVYRHYPLDKPDVQGRVLHPEAGNAAIASECVASLGGNNAFWAFVDSVFGSSDTFDSTLLQKAAASTNIDMSTFQTCIQTNPFAAKIDAMFTEGQKAGIRGTPQSFIIVQKTGEQIPVAGAASYDDMKKVIDLILEKGN